MTFHSVLVVMALMVTIGPIQDQQSDRKQFSTKEKL